MANQSWVSLLNAANSVATGAGTVLNTAVTATISPTTGVGATADYAQVNAASLPLGWYAGLLLRVVARGYLTTTGSSTTATIFLCANKGNNGGAYVTLATPVGITTGTGTVTGLQWTFEALVRCTGIASSGNTVSTQGDLRINNSVPANPVALGTQGMILAAPNTSGETAAAVDTTQTQGICMRGTLAGANATIQLTQWAVEMLD